MLLSCTVVGPAHFSCQLSWCMRFTLRKLAVEVHNDKKPTRKFVSSVPTTVSMDRLASPHWVHAKPRMNCHPQNPLRVRADS